MLRQPCKAKQSRGVELGTLCWKKQKQKFFSSSIWELTCGSGKPQFEIVNRLENLVHNKSCGYL